MANNLQYDDVAKTCYTVGKNGPCKGEAVPQDDGDCGHSSKGVGLGGNVGVEESLYVVRRGGIIMASV